MMAMDSDECFGCLGGMNGDERCMDCEWYTGDWHD